MSYATPADLVARFEADLVAQRAAPEGLRVTGDMLNAGIVGELGGYGAEEVAAIDAAIARIEEALSDATEFVNTHVSDIYAVPLSPLPLMIVRNTCSIGRFYLWGDAAAKDGVEERDYKLAEKTLQAIRDNKLTLGSATKPAPAAEHVSGEVFGPERLFTRDSMKGL